MTTTVQAKSITVTATAQELGVAKQTVYRWIASGQIRTFRLPGGHFRIPLDELERMRTLEQLAGAHG